MAWTMISAAVIRAGGRPLRVTPSRADPGERLDGLILGGGADVDPGLYNETAATLGEVYDAAAGATLGPTARDREEGRATRLWAPAIHVLRRAFARRLGGRIDTDRDALERSLIARAVERRRPILGICRGSQLLNVHFGGTLYPEVGALYVETPEIRTVLPRKEIFFEQGSRISDVMGAEPCRVNALHHQAVRTVGRDLRVVARDRNGVVQAIERAGEPFMIGVQWHPEYIPQHRRQRALFAALLAAAHARS